MAGVIDYSTVDCRVLSSTEDLLAVMKATKEITDWSVLALHFGIDEADYKRIQHDVTIKSGNLHKEVINRWFDTGNATWAALVGHLCDDLVKKKGLAQKIAQEHPVAKPSQPQKEQLPQVQSEVKKSSQTLANQVVQCDGYFWNTESMIGKGIYGSVYKGWNNQKTKEVAVKVVDKSLFVHNQVIERNLKREIDILLQLKNCEYVVGLYHHKDMKSTVVMVMELCECDLSHLIQHQPFSDNQITLLLYQIGEGMKALRAKNIVHRDIKPENILIKYHPKTGRMMIKIADFGFARHFADESMKPQDLKSFAGTPIFMAPEALQCVVNLESNNYYDERVDLWSIGALLYQVIVGQCGFYAQLNHILHIMSGKGDAIAWEAINSNPEVILTPQVKYIYELPPEVDERLSASYKQKMNELLVSLLKLDPNERMTCDEFFDFIDDLVKDKIEVVNLLHGGSVKFIMEPKMELKSFLWDIQSATGVPVASQLIFSPQSDTYLDNAHNEMTVADFNIFINRSGGSEGHAVLYFVPISEVTAPSIEPDYGVIAALQYVVKRKSHCIELMLEHKYARDVTHSISMLQKRIEMQFSSIREFRSFCTHQVGLMKNKLGETRQTLSRAHLAEEWLKDDVSKLKKGTALYSKKMKKLQKIQQEIAVIVQDLESHIVNCENTIIKSSSVNVNDLLKNAQKLHQMSKRIPDHNKEFIYTKCEEMLRSCKGLIESCSDRAHKVLGQLYDALSDLWSGDKKIDSHLKEKKLILEGLLQNQVPQWRSELLLSTTEQIHASQLAREDGVLDSLMALTEQSPPKLFEEGDGQRCDVSLKILLPNLASLVKEFQQKIASVNSVVAEGVSTTFKVTTYDKYKVGDVVMFHPVGKPPSNFLLNLVHLTKPKPYVLLHKDCYSHFSFKFGRIADLVIGKITQPLQVAKFKNDPNAGKAVGEKDSSTRFYYVWAEPSDVDFQRRASLVREPQFHLPLGQNPERNHSYDGLKPDDYSLEILLPELALQVKELQQKIASVNSTVSEGVATIRVTTFDKYEIGDVVMFHPIGKLPSNFQLNLLHLTKPRPYVFLHKDCYSHFPFRFGRMVDLVIAKITQPLQEAIFKDDLIAGIAANEEGSSNGFYYVWADPVGIDFQRKSVSFHKNN